MGNRFARLVLSHLIVVVGLAWGQTGWACDADQVKLSGSWGQAQFSVEIADDPQERQRGLMHRQSMPRSSGMLFLFDFPHRAQFWMKNTLIPLDLIFINQQGLVSRIHTDAVPLDLTSIDGGPGVIAVLEINAGLSEAIGIEIGSFVHHPFFDAETPWPCGQEAD